MPVEKKLFPYDLAVVAIFKDEAPYLREWLDYHLIAGVEHFYLYNNDSSDNFAEVLAPYVAANIVTLINFPGRAMQVPAYEDALEKFRFNCRYIAFIDLDEFIFPKDNLMKFCRVTKLRRLWALIGKRSAPTVKKPPI